MRWNSIRLRKNVLKYQDEHFVANPNLKLSRSALRAAEMLGFPRIAAARNAKAVSAQCAKSELVSFQR